MVLVLCLGDLHIPHRAIDLPTKFKSLLVPGKIQQILCTGNLCTETVYDYLRSVSSDVVVTQGDFDESTRWTDTQVVNLQNFRIGVCHGHQIVPAGDKDALGILIRRLNVDILIIGHTHSLGVYKHEMGCLVINPGSATGAFSHDVPSPTPSFALMDVTGSTATVYMYELVGKDEVKVDKVEFAKEKA